MSIRPPTGGRPAESWISVAISYAGLVALGVPEDSLQSFPEAFRAGMAARAGQLLDYGAERPGALGCAVRERAHPHRGQRLQRLRIHVAPDHGDGAAAVRGISRPDRADRAGLRRPAGRPQPAGLQGLDRSARHRGQRRRSPARPGTTGQGRRVHPRLSGRGRRAAADAAARRAGTQRHVRRAAQVPVARRDVQPLPARACPGRSRSGRCSRRSWWGAGAAARR